MSDETFSFEALGAEIGRLVDSKQEAYGDSFSRSGDIMRMLYPDGIPPEQMTDALAIVRIIDKLFRIATKKDAFGESPFRDIAGYGLLGAHRHDLEGLMAEGQERTANQIEDAIKARQGVYADALSSHDERNDDDVLPESSHDAGWGER